jgi:hypothetical protein
MDQRVVPLMVLPAGRAARNLDVLPGLGEDDRAD